MDYISKIKITASTGVKKAHNINRKKVKYKTGKSTAGYCTAPVFVPISNFIRDFNLTIQKYNYFQLPIDERTGKVYKPDIFQRAAGLNLYMGNDVLITAPTGTGKTAIAHYAITKNLNENKKTFYTTPLKALSNQKYNEFCKIYGKENVGLLTGDTKINTNAPIIIMTTEIYRNKVISEQFNFKKQSCGLPKNLGTVIFDELQYLGDIDRGGVWEQSLMFTPRNVQILSLSATIGNNTDINDWIASLKKQKSETITPNVNYKPSLDRNKKTVLINVPQKNRHVPLYYSLVTTKDKMLTSEADICRETSGNESHFNKISALNYKSLTANLKSNNKLPAIYFIFSRKECKNLLEYFCTNGDYLTNEEEQKQISEIIKKYKENGIYLGLNLNTKALKKGYAIHNAGMIPSQKNLVEELFQKKLIKVVLATETLSAGINMPAKTTVITSPEKPCSAININCENVRELTPNEFHQMAGRAGRRGIDTEGFCISLSADSEQNNIYKKLITSAPNNLESNLKLDFSYIINYLSEFNNIDEFKHVLAKSLYTFNPKTQKTDTERLDNLVKIFTVKKDILKNDNYIDSNSQITIKGELLRHIFGYEQIPIINTLCDRLLEYTDEIQTAAIISGLANLEYADISDFSFRPLSLYFQEDMMLTDALVKAQNEMKKYTNAVKELYPQIDMRINTATLEHIYKWAELNSENTDSRKNWKEMFNCGFVYSLKDEGTLFQEINNTISLLKQLSEICKYGMKYSENKDDIMYYKKMNTKFNSAIKLLQKEPVE